MNDKMIPMEEIRGALRTRQTSVECAAFSWKNSMFSPFEESWFVLKLFSEAEWALRSAEAFLPKGLHLEFQTQFIKRWDNYILALNNCVSFETINEPTSYVWQTKNRLVKWATTFIRQNSKQFDDIMNKQRRKDLENIIKCLLGILKMTDKNEVVNTLEQAIRDLDLAKDEEEMAKDALPDNFYLTERYGDMEDNVTDLYGAIGSVEDILDDVNTLKKYDASVIKEQIENVVADIQKVVDR